MNAARSQEPDRAADAGGPESGLQAYFQKEEEPSHEETVKALEEAKETLLSVHEQQEEVLADTSEAARAVTENLAMRQKKQAEIQKGRERQELPRPKLPEPKRKRSERPRYWQDARREREREEKKRSLPDRRRETRPQPRWEAA